MKKTLCPEKSGGGFDIAKMAQMGLKAGLGFVGMNQETAIAVSSQRG